MGPRGYDEKRDFRRMELTECPFTYRVDGTGEQGTGTVKNLSGSGLLMSCENALSPGTLMWVNVTPQRSLVPPLDALVEVVRVIPVDGRYELGGTIRSFGLQA